jgi:hypothetical protein
MHTERFKQLRKKALKEPLDRAYMSAVWRKIVRDQLRSIEIKDLFDHYDFNYNVEDRATAIRNSVLEGTYTVGTPLIYRMEKKLGICRHLVTPQPADALLLQALVEGIATKLLARQPSENAFYSRDKHNTKKPHDIAEYGLSFREQWKLLQKQIYNFQTTKKLLVVTDLSNYYDSIHLDELRKVFLSLVEANEVIVDLLFKVIEGISWTPDYLPYSRRGLPTSNIEAIRLLAHAFLFELDAVIDKTSGGSFARWMDDITIGVDSREEGIAILSSISDMLKSRGLALNLSKTVILSPREAKHHFQIDKNRYLDSLENVKVGTPSARRAEKKLLKSFNRHFATQDSRHWDKVAKRHITAFGRLKSHAIVDQVSRLYLLHPNLRPNFLIYLVTLGYTRKAAAALLRILKGIDVFDDLSLFQIAFLLTSWEIPRDRSGMRFIKRSDAYLLQHSATQKQPLAFHSLLWFRSKYFTSASLLKFLVKYQNLWQSNSFLRRQATACLSRSSGWTNGRRKRLLQQQALSGLPSCVSLATHISSFEKATTLEGKVRLYLFPTRKQRTYPHAKFLVLCSLLNSAVLKGDRGLRDLVDDYITDPTYRLWLSTDYGIAL